ncbi:MAG: C2H2-type zinc finger protein [Candidatus Nitrosocosmicus sp.]
MSWIDISLNIQNKTMTSKLYKLIELVNESVHTKDDVDIGDIEAVNDNFLVIKRGFVNIHYYYIPISKIEGWDGNVLWLKIREDEVLKKYERDIEPDPYSYYVKSYPYYTPEYRTTIGYSPIAPFIPVRYAIPASYTPTVNEEVSKIIQCDLCGKRFTAKDELSKHIQTEHD